MTLAEAAAVVDVAPALALSPDYTVARLAQALLVLAERVPKCSACGRVATHQGFTETEDEAHDADPFTSQPLARRSALRCEEHAAGLHEAEALA